MGAQEAEQKFPYMMYAGNTEQSLKVQSALGDAGVRAVMYGSNYAGTGAFAFVRSAFRAAYPEQYNDSANSFYGDMQTFIDKGGFNSFVWIANGDPDVIRDTLATVDIPEELKATFPPLPEATEV